MADWVDQKIQYILGGAWPYNGPKPDPKEMEILRARIRKVLEDVYDVDAATGCADDQDWAGVDAEDLREAASSVCPETPDGKAEVGDG